MSIADDEWETMVAMVAAGIFIFRPPMPLNGFLTATAEIEAAEASIGQAEVFVKALEDKLGKL